ALDKAVRRLDGRNIDIKVDIDGLAAATAGLAGVTAATAGARVATQSFGAAAFSTFATVSSQVANMTGMLLASTAVAAGLAVAGAGITAAWGGISTVIATIPAAIALVGVPMALLLADTETLKQRIGELPPAFQQLRTSVANAIADGIVPALQTLATGVLPQISQGVIQVAQTMGQLIQQTANWLATSQGINLVNAILNNVNSTLQAMAPGLGNIARGFMELAAQSSTFEVLSAAVNEFGASFRSHVVNLISDGTLNAAMRGLRTSLIELGQGFSDLVNNGIRLFAAAAPGLNATLDAISGFFNRFNWTSLGQSVSGVFQGIADGINSIPQGTIDAIEQSFARLAQRFQSGEIQAGIQAIADALPGAIDLVGNLATEFGNLAQMVGPAITHLADLAAEVESFSQKVVTSAEDLGTKLGIGKGTAIGEWLREMDDEIDRALGILPPKTEDLGSQTAEGAARGIEQGGAQMGSAAGEAADQVPPAMEQGLAPVPQAVQGAIDPATQAVIESLSQLPPAVQEQFAAMGSAAAEGIAQMTT